MKTLNRGLNSVLKKKTPLKLGSSLCHQRRSSIIERGNRYRFSFFSRTGSQAHKNTKNRGPYRVTLAQKARNPPISYNLDSEALPERRNFSAPDLVFSNFDTDRRASSFKILISIPRISTTWPWRSLSLLRGMPSSSVRDIQRSVRGEISRPEKTKNKKSSR